MTAAKLKELVEAADREERDSQHWHDARYKLTSWLCKHRLDFIRLMEAAEKIADYGCDRAAEFDGPCASEIVKIAQEALAAFKEKA